MKPFDLLKEMNVLCRDNGKEFTDTRRLDVIEEKLRDSKYVCERGNLFRLYSKKPVSEIANNLLLVSSHVDCEEKITECFFIENTVDTIKGTFDNSITNTAILSLMLDGSLPEYVVVAFTGDEEKDSRGAVEVTKYLKKSNKKFFAIVLDVTDFGWKEDVDFTIENNFWKKKIGMVICKNAKKIGYPWLFVPEDPNDIPEFVPENQIIPKEAEPDESCEYDEQDIKCFSLCLPVDGPMHSNKGVITRKRSFLHYMEAIKSFCLSLSAEE